MAFLAQAIVGKSKAHNMAIKVGFFIGKLTFALNRGLTGNRELPSRDGRSLPLSKLVVHAKPQQIKVILGDASAGAGEGAKQ